jgi:uncharacterized protein CbrC (UPF0167 family)
MAYLTYAFPKFYHTEEITADGNLLFREHTNCFAVLHRFDAEGRHLGTEVERVEGTRDSRARDWAKFEAMIKLLGEVEYCDIRIKPFRVQVGQVVHDLIYECVDAENPDDPTATDEYVMLEPNDIMGPVYGPNELDDSLCPWCIDDGSAHQKLDAEFVDEAGIGDYGTWEAVPEAVVHEVAFRTPAFAGWQQERWWTHCGDAAEFLGPVGREEAERAGQEFLGAIRAEAGMEDDDEWRHYLAALDRDHGPTAYLFRCRHCGKFGGYSDCH